MDVMREPGAGIGREIAGGERADAQIDAFISRRDAQRRKDEGERPAQEIWMESERAYDARRLAENRAAWREYHRGQIQRLGGILASLIAHHETQIEKYTDQKGRAA